MNWFQQNRWLGTFLIIAGVCTLAAGYFLFHAKSASSDALAQFNAAAAERSRLERMDPYPNANNVTQIAKHLQNYTQTLDNLKADLKTRMLPGPPLAPNEFQSRLRQAMTAVTDKARANRVKLPDNFALGFDEFTAALPSTAAAPLLGQELAQIEVLLNMIIDARVDGVTALVRAPLPEERAPAATPTPAAGRKQAPSATPAPATKMLERGVVDITFDSTPSAARKILNQLASSNQQFYITRTLHIKNERDKGPPRETPAPGGSATPAPTATPAGKPAPGAALSFIVGNEHIETSARIELIRFTF
jgi:hypothetical protein